MNVIDDRTKSSVDEINKLSFISRKICKLIKKIF